MKDGKYQVLIVDDESEAPIKIFGRAMKHDKENKYIHEPLIHPKPDLEGVELDSIDLVLLDHKFKGYGITGLSILNELFEINKLRTDRDLPKIRVILYSAYEDLHLWKQDLLVMYRKGVADFVDKNDDPILLKLKMDRALDLLSLEKNNVYLKKENLKLRKGFAPDIVGDSAKTKAMLTLIEQIAATDVTVLITGESGTGKELVARSIHFQSNRRKELFVAVNCSYLTDELIGSELFGHEKGAFTGAISQRPGRFEYATKGTIFLDEVGEMDRKLQPRLLRVLQEKTFERIGGNETLPTDARVIAASNRNLKSDVGNKRFREDLFFRLNVVPIHVPPLRDRKDDIELLATHFIAQKNEEHGKNIEALSPLVIDKLMSYDWPGNVRELENTIERAVVTAKGPILMKEDINFGADSPEQEGFSVSELESESSDPIVEKLINDRDKAKAAFINKYDQESFDFLKNHYSGSRWRGLWDKYKLLRGFKIEDNTDYTTEQKVAIADEMKKALIDRGETTKKRWAIAMAMGMTENSLKGMVHHLKRKNKGSSA